MWFKQTRQTCVAMLAMLGVAWCTHAQAAPCSASQVQQLNGSLATAQAQADLPLQAQTLQQLRSCQPQRGDLLVELLQVQVQQGNLAEALALRQELIANNAPAGIVTLVDGLLAAARFKTPEGAALVRTVDYDLPRSVRLGLGVGHDTNPNFGSDARAVLLNIGGVDQLLQLGPNSLPQASGFQTLKLDAVLPRAPLSPNTGRGNSAWLLGGQLTRYNSGVDGGSQLDYLLYGGQVLPGGACSFALRCRQVLLLGVGQTRQENYEFINHRYSMDWANLQFAWSTSGLRRNGELDSVRLGGDWAITPAWLGLSTTQDMVLDVGAAYDVATANRAGGDQLRARLGAIWLPTPKLALNARSEWINDLDDYAPALFGNRQRRVSTLTLKGDYTLKKTYNGIYNLLVEKRISDSNISLFSNNSLRLELNYQQSLGL